MGLILAALAALPVIGFLIVFGRMTGHAIMIGMLAVGTAALAGALGAEVRTARDAIRSSSWSTAEGRIVDSSIDKERGRRSWGYVLRVDYEYSVDGLTYRGDRVLYLDDVRAGTGDALRRERDRLGYQSGNPVRVYYDPDEPGRAVLRPGLGVGLAVLLMLAAILTLAGAAYLATWWRRVWLSLRGSRPPVVPLVACQASNAG